MRETGFINQNKEKWNQFEQALKQGSKDPDELSKVFLQVTDDLSYARTFYPNRSVRVYLNNLGQRFFTGIYKNKRDMWRRFAFFWKEELPALVYSSRKELLLSLIIFLACVGIGVFSSVQDPNFARTILGDSYINMTLENIEKGDPMAVYKQANEVDMFFGITWNNLRVAFLTFISGIFYAVGSVLILFYNGVMVGVFQYFFIEKGFFWESFLTIWMHGVPEISCIIIAGGAGIVLGKGPAFPGTYSRIQSLQISARKALKIMLGITPIIIYAGLVEAFVTRYTELPDLVRGGFIGVSLFFILLYFVWYPIKKAKKGFKFDPGDIQAGPSEKSKVNYAGVKRTSELFKNAFTFVRIHGKRIALTCMAISLLYLIGASFILYEDAADLELLSFIQWLLTEARSTFSSSSRGNSTLVALLFNYSEYPAMFLINSVALSVVLYTVFTRLTVDSKLKSNENQKKNFKPVGNYFKSLIIAVAILGVTAIPGIWTFLPIVFLIPVLLMWGIICTKESLNIFSGISRFFFLIKGSYWKSIGLFLMLLLVCFFFFIIIDSPLVWFYAEVIKINILADTEVMQLIFMVFTSFITLWALGMVAAIITAGCGLNYFSAKEIKEAVTLKSQIAELAKKQKK